ncbi:glycosyltransferase [Halococcus hamelinensis]|uniref:Glycosyl transferase, group 1 n=1 Tax=Halococcus hamelinensis 100A6 TaxID=1132509 RepID=M0LTJ2_9EURY|nr:glycosyltransferase [Halococcus hamelinensis]EMA36877.1 glycosyl transferase, group 1 [Halococcus hamelinensis 100A6]
MSLPVVGFVILVDVLDDQNAAYPAVQNFIELYINETEEILIFGPSDADIDREGVKVIPLPRDAPKNTVFRILSYVWYQCRLAIKLFQARNHCDSIFFHIGGTAMLLPVIACRLGGSAVNLFVLGSVRISYQQNHKRGIVSRMITRQLVALEWVTSRLADRILVLSEGMVSPGDGQLSTAKRVASNLNYIDCDRFERGPPVSERPYDIVYIGRFEQEKGIVKLANALTRLAERRPDVRVKLIGDGSLYDEVTGILQDGDATEQVDLTGWVDHEAIPTHLAESQLLVLPSESEGVPKTILEALACGTIPVATPVGGVPDVVSDETGVLLTDNNPETIARVLDRTLNRDDLDEMASRGRAYIRSIHSFEATAERFRAFLASDVDTDTPT